MNIGLVSVMFACNDELGVFEGCARHVEFENVIELEAISATRPPRIAFIEFEGLVRMVRISGRLFPVRQYRNYTRNICCASILMEPAVATAMLNFLKSKGAFSADAAATIHDRGWWHSQTERFSVTRLEAACSA